VPERFLNARFREHQRVSSSGRSWPVRDLQQLECSIVLRCCAIVAFLRPNAVCRRFRITGVLNFFVDLEFLMEQLPNTGEFNLLCVYRNPHHPPPYGIPAGFEFLGYDLVDVEGSASALTNCGGFPDVFDDRELSSTGLLTSYPRAVQVQSELRAKHPGEHHADCHLWAIARSVERCSL
jgi:hypothetical protein